MYVLGYIVTAFLYSVNKWGGIKLAKLFDNGQQGYYNKKEIWLPDRESGRINEKGDWVDSVERKEISNAVIKRLPRYHRYLGELMESGVERISSNDLSSKMNVTASQIRQDLNNFGGFGQQGYGYNVEYLYNEIAKILGIDRQNNMIIIGGGNFGQALPNYSNFERRGFIIQALFDINPERIGKTVRGIETLDMKDLESFLSEHDIDIAVLTIPKASAQEVADRLVADGIKAIWNFAHLDLKVPEDVVVENVHLSESLMQLSYRISEKRDKK